MLCMVSKTISNRLITYISTPSGNRRLLLQDFHNIELPGKREGSYILEHYKSLGDPLMQMVTITGETNLVKRFLLLYALIGKMLSIWPKTFVQLPLRLKFLPMSNSLLKYH